MSDAFARTTASFLLAGLATLLGSLVGCDLSRTTSPTALVESVAPVPGFTTSVNGRNVTVTSTAVGAETFSYDWGDNTSNAFLSGSGSHSYANDGVFTIIQEVTNEAGSASTSRTVVVGDPDPAPVADFEFSNITGLRIEIADRSNNAVAWTYDFGDGGVLTIRSPNYTYRNPGTYTVTQTVTNSSGETDRTDKTVTVF